jgi:hypothetical protein
VAGDGHRAARAGGALTRALTAAVLAATLTALAAPAAGCDGSGRTGTGGRDRPAAARITVPAAAHAACERLARRSQITVLCPPAGGGPLPPLVRLIHEDLDPTPCAYLMNLDSLGPEPGDRLPFHLLLGGSCVPFPLTARHGRWTADPPASLRLVGSPPVPSGGRPTVTRPHVLRRVTVRGHPGLLLRSDPLAGPLNAGHYALVWNEHGAGYAISAHYPSGDRREAPRPDQVRALQALAASLRPAAG